MKKVFINSEYITLSQFLKLEGFIASGGEDDVIKIDGQEFIIVNEN